MKIETKFSIRDKVCYLKDFFNADGVEVKRWVITEVYAIQINYGEVIRYLTDDGWFEEDDLKSAGRELTEEEIDGGF